MFGFETPSGTQQGSIFGVRIPCSAGNLGGGEGAGTLSTGDSVCNIALAVHSQSSRECWVLFRPSQLSLFCKH